MTDEAKGVEEALGARVKRLLGEALTREQISENAFGIGGREDAPAPGEKLHLLDLFSGIGGFSLGLERSGGFETVAFCEIEPFCRRVLAKHWPGVPIYDDVRTLTAGRLAADGIGGIDAICGGFPCQDISLAGKGNYILDSRNGLG